MTITAQILLECLPLASLCVTAGMQIQVLRYHDRSLKEAHCRIKTIEKWKTDILLEVSSLHRQMDDAEEHY